MKNVNHKWLWYCFYKIEQIKIIDWHNTIELNKKKSKENANTGLNVTIKEKVGRWVTSSTLSQTSVPTIAWHLQDSDLTPCHSKLSVSSGGAGVQSLSPLPLWLHLLWRGLLLWQGFHWQNSFSLPENRTDQCQGFFMLLTFWINICYNKHLFL